MRRKLLIWILSAIMIIGVVGCGAEETTSSTSSKREKTSREEDTSKEEKTLKLDLFSNDKTIIDEMELYKTTYTDIKQYLDKKHIIYNENLETYISEDFLGYDCTYAFTIVGEDSLETAKLTKIRINLLFKDNAEFIEGGKAINNYLYEKTNSLDGYDVFWEEGVMFFPIKFEEGVDDFEGNKYGYEDLFCVSVLEKDNYDNEGGYYEKYYMLEYVRRSKILWDDTQTNDKETDETKDNSSEISDNNMQEEIDYQAISDKFAGTYEPADGGADTFFITEYSKADAKYHKEYGNGYMFLQQYRGDWWDFSDIISYDGTTVKLSFEEGKRVGELTYVDENTVLYNGEKFIRYRGEDSQSLDNLDIESEVNQIKEYYYTTQNNLDSYIRQNESNMTMYNEDGFPVKIVVKSGYNNWDCTREYFYHDKQLYFAFVYNEDEQYRLYFKDGVMIRFIDSDKNAYDYGNLDAFYNWQESVIGESNGIYPK